MENLPLWSWIALRTQHARALGDYEHHIMPTPRAVRALAYPKAGDVEVITQGCRRWQVGSSCDQPVLPEIRLYTGCAGQLDAPMMLTLLCCSLRVNTSPKPAKIRGFHTTRARSNCWQSVARAQSIGLENHAVFDHYDHAASSAPRCRYAAGSAGMTCREAACGLNSGVSTNARNRAAVRLRRPSTLLALRPLLSRSASLSICI